MSADRKSEARIEFVSLEKVVKPGNRVDINGVVRVKATDEKASENAVNLLRDFAEVAGAELTICKKNSEGRSVAFSKKSWNSSWEPTGPTPPWANNPGNN